ncbi:ThuA domain-containing protein [Nocardioides sp. zg-1228]|uniref:ThuA domain-containing protein n=1 Tax=Nocardioides sp. zg-1228 TaxID=2763008 RepID=UPI0016428FA4|nr:ThuA domain-containing protein [Nocardioides sp. zg-1228]MBC2933548.1 ThuA domain-containing protein [Nocardioides sp. zg-1228]QSF56324.1 ThuA domain-containing protein [Nocardioides sp. zg-1228]
MRKPISLLATGLCAGALLLTGTTLAPAGAEPKAAPAAEPYKVLVVGKTLGFRHSHIDETTNAVIELGKDNGFTVDVWDPPIGRSPGQPDLTMATTPFTSTQALSQYATIMFASPVDGTNNQNPASPRTLDDAELAAFQGYIRQGGGFVGLHAATDEMHAVPWFSRLTGGSARFLAHPAQQQATMVVESPTHPSTTMLPKRWSRFDEWYNFTANPREDVHVLITLDESTYSPGRGAMGADHPIAWCHNFEGGRSWYEGAGHVEASYTDPLFLAHLLGGIEWTAGVVEGGGNCVTFPEVVAITADLADDGGNRNAKLGRDVAEYLAAAEAAAEEGDHAQAAHILKKAKGKAHGLQDATLVAKIGDLVEWQSGLVGY